jgi:hypothetical protein
MKTAGWTESGMCLFKTPALCMCGHPPLSPSNLQACAHPPIHPHTRTRTRPLVSPSRERRRRSSERRPSRPRGSSSCARRSSPSCSARARSWPRSASRRPASLASRPSPPSSGSVRRTQRNATRRDARRDATRRDATQRNATQRAAPSAVPSARATPVRCRTRATTHACTALRGCCWAWDPPRAAAAPLPAARALSSARGRVLPATAAILPSHPLHPFPAFLPSLSCPCALTSQRCSCAARWWARA